MKKVFSASTKIFLVASVAVLSIAAFSSCNKDNNDSNNNNKTYSISGNASGSQMVPSVSGNGTGTISGTYDPNTMVLNYTTNWSGLTGAPTSGGFYSGASGANGTMIGSVWNMGAGLSSTGSYTGQMTLTADQASQLTSGNWYYTMGTATNTSGEVRGQITATANP